MPQLLPQSEILIPNTSDPQKAVKYINSYIDSVKCENMSVDISFMNIIDASHVSTLCSTKHYIKYPEGKISWIVSSKLVETLTSALKLGNSDYYYTDR